jgi:hypothetical protein
MRPKEMDYREGRRRENIQYAKGVYNAKINTQ